MISGGCHVISSGCHIISGGCHIISGGCHIMSGGCQIKYFFYLALAGILLFDFFSMIIMSIDLSGDRVCTTITMLYSYICRLLFHCHVNGCMPICI